VLAYLGFFAIYVLGYGGLQYCCWRKLRHLVRGRRQRVLFMAWFILQLALPILTRVAERSDWLLTARLLAWPGYLWMGYSFLLLVFAMLIDLPAGLLVLLRRRRPDAVPPPGTPRIFKLTGPVAAVLALLVTLYGAYAARQMVIEQHTLTTGKLPAALPRLRIVQISDLHIGIMTDPARLTDIVAQVRALQPDLLVATGDVVDGTMAPHQAGAAAFAALQPRYGKFAVTGNHEFYAGLAQALTWLNDAGFQVLRGESSNYHRVINLAGVDDYATNGELPRAVDERELLATLPRDQFTLLLRHRPDVPANTVGLFDLQLSGHTHRGQIFPFTGVVWLATGHTSGWYEAGNNSRLYVSRGLGTWGPPLRVFSPPEITVFDLVRG